MKIQLKKESIVILAVVLISVVITVFIWSAFNFTTNWGILLGMIILFTSLFILLSYLIRYLFLDKDEKEFRKNMKFFFSLLTIIILLAQLAVFYNQTNVLSQQKEISQQQNQLLAQTSQTAKANLLLVSSQGYQSYNYNTLKDYSYLAVGVINLGKSIAPFTKISISSDLFVGNVYRYKEQGISPEFIVKDLKSTDYNSTFFKFWLNPLNYNNFTLGEKNVTFEIDCPYCENSISYQNITVCIYNQTSSECGEKWKQ